jgi:hypothetical protein
MRTTRVVLVASALIAGVVFLQSAILTLYGYVFNIVSVATFDGSHTGNQSAADILPFLPGILISDLIIAAAFGVGVLISLRLIRPITADHGWKRVAVRGIIAAAIGAVAVLAVRMIGSLLTSVRIGPYPLGYSFTPSFDTGNVQLGFANALGQLLNPFIEFAPLVVLACVFLKLWVARVPPVKPLLTDTQPTKGRASASA